MRDFSIAIVLDDREIAGGRLHFKCRNLDNIGDRPTRRSSDPESIEKGLRLGRATMLRRRDLWADT
jgi:hypothetical protein